VSNGRANHEVTSFVRTAAKKSKGQVVCKSEGKEKIQNICPSIVKENERGELILVLEETLNSL